MMTFSQIYAALRQKNKKQYALLAGCCFFSVLLITTYVCMMRSPTVLSVLPEGGDSRKQVMMIFVLAVIGCGVFTAYASGLFFRYKSREVGIFLALGTTKSQIKKELLAELSIISIGSCTLGALLGTPFAWIVWRLFRLLLVDSEDMLLRFDPQAYFFAAAFSVFVILTLFIMMLRFIRRTNIIDVVNESRKSEPIKNVSPWYGPVGILLIIAGMFLGYLVPSFCILILQWYPPEGLTSVFYLPAIIGLYMILLHTVVNGWRKGKNYYKNIVTTSMMKFQGRQTVRNMLVITVLIAGAYFAAFYTPMLATGSMMQFEQYKTDYSFCYRSDQDIPSEEEIRQMAENDGVTITDYTMQPIAILGIDGEDSIETEGSMGTTYVLRYSELLMSKRFLSESAYESLTGEQIDLAAGTIASVYDDNGMDNSLTSNNTTLVTNALTGKKLNVTPQEDVLKNTMLFDYKVLDDTDYAALTEGLTAEWMENQVFFNVSDVWNTYGFARELFNEIVDRSGPEVELFDAWDPVAKKIAEETDQPYSFDTDELENHGFENIDYDKRNSSVFRLYWKYMPQFRVLDKADFMTNTAVFLMLFIFIAIICFSAVIVISYTRSITIAYTNAKVYDDLRHLGASPSYLRMTVRTQISKIFFIPILTGTCIIFGFYMMIMYFNDSMFSTSEFAGIINCLYVVIALSLFFYGVYRLTLKRVCSILTI